MMRRFMLAMIMALSLIPSAQAANGFDYGNFAIIPILHEGRVKPLDSFARVELQKIYGDDRYHGMPAIQFLAVLLFNPAAALDAPLFTIRDPQLMEQLGLNHSGNRLFSLSDISPGLGRTEPLIPALMQAGAKPTPSQKALLQLHENALAMAQIMGALNMVLPLDDGRTWRDLPETNPIRRAMAESGAQNTALRIIPPDGDAGEWKAPWQATGSPLLATLADMATAYRNDDAAGWAGATRDYTSETAANIAGVLRLETCYRAIAPLGLAEMGYGLALILCIGSLWPRYRKLLWRSAMLVTTGAMVLHAGAITCRVFILDRPPVATLYETLLFVSLVMILSAAVVEAVRRDSLALLAGLAGGLTLLYAAPVFAPMGDSMEVLVAVLNTNFWLATHVICITIGYGVSLLAALLAHFALLRRELRLNNVVQKTLIAALFFTAFGTVLGGIWADQSWGRFWGWDPKENGALLIVLWIAWILHGRYGGHLKNAFYHAATAALSVVVALAWFGVNLLNVGLHSYGFTDAMALGLVLFCGFEVVLITALTLRARHEEKAA